MGSDIVTRDGNPLRELGSWEKEQLKTMENKIAPPKPKQIKRGRKPLDIEARPNLFINRVNDGTKNACWVVKPVVDDKKLPHKYFRDSVNGGKDKAYELAVVYRNQIITEAKEKQNVGQM